MDTFTATDKIDRREPLHMMTHYLIQDLWHPVKHINDLLFAYKHK